MKMTQIISDIVFLPQTFFEKNVSMYSLLRESGYFEMYTNINEDDIYRELIRNPDCIKLWLNLSEDKRSSSGWFLKIEDNGKYIVGFFPSDVNFKQTEYFDEAKACAAFIKKEIEFIRLMG